MPSRYLHPLVCTKCGAALPAADGQQILVCPYCGQSHAFLPPQLEPGPSVGTTPANTTQAVKVALVGFGVILFGAIAFSALLAGRGAATTATATATPTATNEPSTMKGTGDPKAVYKKSQAVDIQWGSSWWAGSIVEVDGNKYKAHYEGYGSGSDEWVRADRLRPRTVEDAGAETSAKDAGSDARTYREPAADGGDPNATYENGEAVDVLWGSTWWGGTIKKKEGSRYRIGYDGWSSSSDEWVTAKRLRKRGAP